MQTTLIIIHVIIAIILIGTVLMQQGKQQGLSGAIAGGAETFFGKNKGRTIDGVLKKVTAVVAALFVISSIALAVYTTRSTEAEAPVVEQTETVPAEDVAEQAEATDAEATEGAEEPTETAAE